MDPKTKKTVSSKILTKKLVTIFLLATVVSLVTVYTARPTVHAASPPIIKVNGPSSPCMNSGTQFTTTVTASNMTNTMSWQLNVTFINITPINYSLGNMFSTSNGNGIAASRINAVSYLIGFSYYNGGGPLTTTSRTTLATFAWQTTQNSAPISIHIVTSRENVRLGTQLLDPSQNNLPFNTADYFGCGSPNLSLPALEGFCLASGAPFTTTFRANNLTSVNAWQINITYTGYPVAERSISMGTSFTGANTIVSNSTNNTKGWFLLKFNFTNGASITTTSSTILFSLTWKTLQYHAFAVFHIVLSTENTSNGTYLWNTAHRTQQYITTDGDLACQV